MTARVLIQAVATLGWLSVAVYILRVTRVLGPDAQSRAGKVGSYVGLSIAAMLGALTLPQNRLPTTLGMLALSLAVAIRLRRDRRQT